jgi:hypothetical protein
MSKPTRWALVCAGFVCAGAFVLACATGGASGGGGDDVQDPQDAAVTDPPKDSNVSTMVDAPMVKMDAPMATPDAAVQPDAPPGSLLCTTNTDCTTAGQCCFAIGGQGFCVPGTVILGACFPIN